MTLTTEQLNNMADGNWPDSGFFEMIKEMARELLANRVAKPVGFISAKHGPVLYGEHIGLPAGTHFYTIPSATLQRQHECMSRKAFPWVEGAVVPVWVRSLAAGVQGCESVYIVAELDADKQSQGWPQFITAYIDIRLGRCVCGGTAEDVSGHVLRYLPFDHSEVHAPHAE
ncbi:hypothetical protein ACKUTL_18795 [Serratia marcescens]|uniref:hypothetical protein n=1 Tax=Serratia marcescens TaxID=615 RepID=UPI001BD30525|nr:hypothetical protein [Serratia marcescens]